MLWRVVIFYFQGLWEKGGYMKKLICSILTIVLVLSLFVPASYAAKWDYDEIFMVVEQTNEEIDKLIDAAIEEVAEVDESSNKADMEINKIIDKVIKETEKLADKVLKEAGKVGIEIVCDYVEIEIGGRFVLIDPLIVISF